MGPQLEKRKVCVRVGRGGGDFDGQFMALGTYHLQISE